MTNPARNHPQAAAVTSMSISAAAVTWLIHKVGYTVPDYYAVAIAGTAMSALTWIGRTGLKGIWKRIWNGSGS